MERIFFIVLIVLCTLCGPAIADDECPFDQENQIEVLKKLQKKYQNSELIEIPRFKTRNYDL